MNTITKNAYAKINLSLDILSTRPDGYHEVRMIMQNIGLCDELELVEKYIHGLFPIWGIRFISIVDNADPSASLQLLISKRSACHDL